MVYGVHAVLTGVTVTNHCCSATPSACDRPTVVAERNPVMGATRHSTLYASFTLWHDEGGLQERYWSENPYGVHGSVSQSLKVQAPKR